MYNELCMNCFSVKGKYRVCPYCGHVEGSPPKEPYHLPPGTLLKNGRYLVGVSVATGGFGIIYKAYDKMYGVITAVKEFYPAGLVNRAAGTTKVGLLSGEGKEEFQKSRHNFLLEAQVLLKFQNEVDIVQVYDGFEENETAYIVMEYMEGILLKDALQQRGGLRPEQAVTLTLAIIEAVEKVHRQGIIHRDISPDNIYWTKKGIKLFDFGSAAVIGKGNETPMQAVVKPGYTPPEQYRQKGAQGYYTDIYSIGAMLYEMITGTKPIEASERTVRDSLKKPGELGIALEANLERTVMKALAVDPRYRFQNVGEFREALENKRASEFPEIERKKKKGKRNLIAAVSAVALLAVAVGIALFIKVIRPGLLSVKLKEDTIAVWIPVEQETDDDGGAADFVPTLETITLDGDNAADMDFSKEKDYREQYRFYDAAEMACEFLTDQEYPDNANITVELVPVPQQEYGEKFAEEAADDGDGQPVLFLTEGLGKESRDDYADLSQFYDSLQLEDYYLLSGYRDLFPECTELPTGFDTLFLYWREKVGQEKTELELAGDETTVDLETDILEPARKGGKKLADFVGWDADSLAETLYLIDPSMAGEDRADFSKALIADTQLMYKMQSAVRNIHHDMSKWFDSYESRLAGIIADSSLLRSETISAAKGNYEARLLCYNGKSLAACRDVYAVNAHASENQKNAAMRLLIYMLTQNAQSLNYQQHKRALPLRRDVFDSYLESETQLEPVLRDPVAGMGTKFDTMEKLGEARQTVFRCNNDLNADIFAKENAKKKDISTYLKAYE